VVSNSLNAQILNVLRGVKYPGYSRDIVSFGIVKEAEIVAGDAGSGLRGARVVLEVTTNNDQVLSALQNDVNAALREAGFEPVRVFVNAGNSTPAAPQPRRIAGVRKVIAVASGKGGVGKSTFAVNLACALAPLRVGLLDCDIHGPSVPLMLGVTGTPEIVGENSFAPLMNHGVKVMSLGFFVDRGAPVIWRGPMIMKTIQQFAAQVAWGELDVLVVDLPPGTGDAPLSLAQTVALDGVVIVTTPQAAAVEVALRGAALFTKLDVPLLGVAENMSWLEQPDGSRLEVFGNGGGETAARALDTDLLGQVPLDPKVREGGDNGLPVVVGDSDCAAAQAFRAIAAKITERLR
jgi:ATP-binding protein involved in chromosome partitioning